MLESGNPAIFASGVSVDPTVPTGTSPTRTPPTMTLECLIWAIFGHNHINISGKGLLVPFSWLHFLATLAHLPPA